MYSSSAQNYMAKWGIKKPVRKRKLFVTSAGGQAVKPEPQESMRDKTDRERKERSDKIKRTTGIRGSASRKKKAKKKGGSK